MLFLCTRLNLCSTTVGERAFRCFVEILKKCGISEGFQIPQTPNDLSSREIFQPFLPLFTPYFHFHNQQLTTLGDTVIDDYLSAVLLDYGSHSGLLMSVNTSKQLNSIFHNHYSLQLFAHELRLDDLAIPLTHKRAPGDVALDFLETQRPPLRDLDTAGTSFYLAPLPSGQSPLGWKLSHFIGCLQRSFGNAVGMRALQSLYDLDNTGDVVGRASSLLLRTVERFPASNVAGALLAAQGVPVRFVGKTRLLPQDDHNHTEGKKRSSQVDSEAQNCDSRNPTPVRNLTCYTDISYRNVDGGHPNDHLIALGGFGTKHSLKNISLDAIADSKNARETLAAGPGVVDYVQIWKQRTAELVERKLESPPEVVPEDGWMTTAEQRQYKNGPAFSHTVDFSLFRSFADEYGCSQPVDGRWVGRRKFKKAVRDPLFYDKRSDMRNGVPFSTNGEPLQDYLERFDRAHERLFEVTMLTGMYEERVLGRAIASRYTVARELACRAYLGGVLNDLSMLLNQHEG
ncbi:unnamed protein product [Phytomonas sp. Hart1]|nr:unnamed protein product [Phytomonas sp. Hart1]|eukprot:CCW66115.1 unnamed protein product [Phytomonas sp. isolate Hart1]